MNPITTIKMENGDEMVLELYMDKAPITCANFINLANDKYYDGLSFHRVVKDFVIQGGSHENICVCESPFHIPGEFKENGHDTGLDHSRGAISMARSDEYDSAGTQFFIVHQDAHRLDEKYASFGMLIEGFDVLDKISSVDTLSKEENNKPLVKQTIKTITINISNEEAGKLVRLP